MSKEPTNNSIKRFNMIECNDNEIEKISQQSAPKRSPSIITTSVLNNHSNLPKNVRFQNKTPYKHQLRSTTSHITLEDLVAQHIFHPTHAVNHIYKADETKEIINSSLQGENSHI